MRNRLSKKILSVFLAAALLTALLPNMAVPAFADTSGSWADHTTAVTPDDDDVYTVTTAEELAWVAAQANSSPSEFYGSTVELGGDIDLSDHFWVPISNDGFPFQGDFDGNDHTISGLTIDGSMQLAGLFGRMGSGTIQDVTLEDVSIDVTYNDQNGYVGGIAGFSGGLLKNCSVEGEVSLSSSNYYAYCGGLVGISAEGSIESCSVSGSVTAAMEKTDTHCGGLVGHIYNGSVSDCFSDADVGESADSIGGLVGKLSGTPVTGCRATGAVSNGFSFLPPFTGGLIGYAIGGSGIFIEDCHASGDVTQGTDGGVVGGFTGACAGYTVSGCSATGDVSGGNETGGFTGRNEGTITDSYATGSAAAGGSDLNSVCGGFVGYNGAGAVTKCYAIGDAEGGQTGGFAGWVCSGSSVSLSYAAGTVTGNYSAGGFACNVGGSISDCYSTGDVTGETYAGGFVSNSWSGAAETNCYSVGDADVTGSSDPGGFVGKNQGSDTNCYWLSGTADAAVGFVESGSTPTAAVELTDDEMQAAEFVTALNDDRTPGPWIAKSGVNNDYPVLVGVGDGAGEKHTVTFKDGDDESKTYRVKEISEGSTVSEPADPKKDGFKFDGWYDGPSGDEDAEEWDFETGTVTGDLTLYAHWTLETYGVSGTVSSALGTISVDGLTVGLYASGATDYSGEPLYSAETDEDGFYSIPVVDEGTYVAVIAAGGAYAESKSAPFEAGDGEDVTADIKLNILCTISGTVTLPDGETAAPGATVKLYNVVGFFEALAYLDTTTADDNGAYRFSVAIPDGNLYFVFASPYTAGGKTYCGNFGTVTADAGEETEYNDVDVRLADLGNSWLAYAEEPDDYTPGDDEIYIDTPEELAWLSEQSLLYFEDFGESVILLGDDLDLGAHEWWPIGSTAWFAGGFYGDGHVISNLKVSALYDGEGESVYSLWNAGLFGDIRRGWVEDLGLENVSVTFGSDSEDSSELCVGALAGHAEDAWIEGCYSTGGVSSSVPGSVAGGLIGMAQDSDIYECYSECGVSSASEGYGGGLLGRVYDSDIVDCYATGDVAGVGRWNGGLIGLYDGACIVNCYAVGDVGGAEYNGSFAGYGRADDIEDLYEIHWLGREELPGIASGEDGVTLNDPDSGCGMSADDMATQAFADTLNSDDEEQWWEWNDPWKWDEDVNGGYPVLDGVGVGNETSAPSVTTQPISLTVTAGETASFTAEADGYPAPAVQWQVSTDGGLTFADIDGADEETYLFTAALADSGKQFRAVFTNFVDTAFSNAATLTVNRAASAKSSSGKSDKNYISRTLIDKASGVSVSGTIREDADLTVTDTILHTAGSCAACDEIRSRIANGDLLALLCKDISLSKNFHGSLTVTLPVGSRHNGERVTILHCDGGTLETFTATVKNGKVTFSVTSLSPFAVFAASDAPEENPDTGVPAAGFPLWLIPPVLGALCGLRPLRRRLRRA
ncbi:MAG TPA: GLUG motif-containing protein [Oscillospiraceae bacterium]|nr:InlB B-repeat-containing protein [Oscillospiraceae bacterium]HNW04506.1 GLUG motif-containing protein [Oscillospiraceae bacterium]